MRNDKTGSKQISNLIVGILLLALSIGLLYLVVQIEAFSGVPSVSTVLMIIAGMVTITAITAFQRYIEG